MSLVEQRDFILLAMGEPFALRAGYWQQVATQLEARLGVTVGLLPSQESSAIPFWASLWNDLELRRMTRLLIITLGQRSSVLQCLRDALAWRVSVGGSSMPNRELGVQFAKVWSEVDWAELFACSPLAYSHCWRLTTHVPESRTSLGYLQQREEVSGIVWEMRRLGLDADYVFLEKRSEATFPVGAIVKLPWIYQLEQKEYIAETTVSRDVEIVEDGHIHPSTFQEIVPPDAWVHVLVKKYLEGIKYCIKSESFLSEGTGTPLDRVGDWRNGYEELLFRMEELLPSEYRGKADSVSPNSMGSALIEIGADGLVAWDKIWTSFCDLALAGGPPHRGKLLEAVSNQECAANLEAYESVVQEIERGVQLVTGLKTVKSTALGWVGVECDDQQMAALLMRAIIVENVMVRREGSVIYLPAGPHFQLTKEIKNVITTIAKTVHYWRDH